MRIFTPTRGAQLIAEERNRQIKDEGWTPEHDNEHIYGELPRAAACYAIPEHARHYGMHTAPSGWPWEPGWWKPSPDDRVRELTKAGALIAAEIDRLLARS